MGCMACTEPQCLYNSAIYLYLYLYSPYVPYGLYRASVPVQRCTLPLPIPLLPLCAVRPVQQCTLPLPIPLLPLCAVRPVQSLSASTRVHFTFTYTSTPPMCHTACTEPQCLYNGALYLYLPKHWYQMTRLQGVTQQNNTILIFTALRIWNLRKSKSNEPNT